VPTGRRLRVPDDVVTVIRGLHPTIKARIRAALDTLREDATLGKPLRDELSGLKSLRVGRFRIVYREASGNVLEIVAIGPRASIYRETFRLIAREDPGRR
jgi:mRNA interferase RelE/StbE